MRAMLLAVCVIAWLMVTVLPLPVTVTVAVLVPVCVLLWESIPLLGAVPPLWSMLVAPPPGPSSMLAMLFAVWVSDCVIDTVLPSPVTDTVAVLLPFCVLVWESVPPAPLLVLPVPEPVPLPVPLLLVEPPTLFDPVCVLLWLIVTVLPVPVVPVPLPVPLLVLPVPVLLLVAPIVTLAVLLPV
jgi:signal-induced proliferation-associated 1 like protein 3